MEAGVRARARAALHAVRDAPRTSVSSMLMQRLMTTSSSKPRISLMRSVIHFLMSGKFTLLTSTFSFSALSHFSFFSIFL